MGLSCLVSVLQACNGGIKLWRIPEDEFKATGYLTMSVPSSSQGSRLMDASSRLKHHVTKLCSSHRGWRLSQLSEAGHTLG